MGTKLSRYISEVKERTVFRRTKEQGQIPRKTNWLCVWFVLTLASLCVATDAPRNFTIAGASFELGDGSLSIRRQIEETTSLLVIGKDGVVILDGSEVATEKSDRKLLKELVKESDKMAELLDEIGAIVAAQQDPNADPKDLEKLGKQMLKKGKSLEKQNLRVANVAQKLIDRVPELVFLRELVAE